MPFPQKRRRPASIRHAGRGVNPARTAPPARAIAGALLLRFAGQRGPKIGIRADRRAGRTFE